MWDIIDDAFDLYRERFALLLGITAVTLVPVILVASLCSDLFVNPLSNSGDQFGAWTLIFWLVTLPFFVFMTVLRMGAIAAVVDGEFRGHPLPNTVSAYRIALRHAGPLIAVALFAAVSCVVVAAPTIGFGAVYFCVGAAFLAPAVVLEDRRWISAIKRSFNLTGTDRGRVFGVTLLLYGIAAVLALGLSGLAHWGYSLLPMGDITSVARETQETVASQVVGGIVVLTLEPLISIAVILLYFDLRVRRQGIDLAAQAEEFGVSLAVDPFGDLASANVVVRQERERKRAARKAQRK